MNVEIFCERGSQGRGAMFLGRLLGRGALFLRRSQGARGVRWEEEAFARAQGRGALFLGRSQGQAAFAGGKNRVYDCFCSRREIFL